MPDNTTLIGCITVGCTVLSVLTSFVTAKWVLNSQIYLKETKDIITLIEKINSSATAFWLSSGRDILAEEKLKGKLQRLNFEIEAVFVGQKDILKTLNKKNIQLRMQITGGTFENEERQIENGRASNIRDMCQDMINIINNNKKQKCKLFLK